MTDFRIAVTFINFVKVFQTSQMYYLPIVSE